jgi:CubicO group peptidase (beta-lactamase class C family)
MHQVYRIWKALVVILLLAGTSTASAQPDKLMVDSIFADLTKPGSPGCALGVYRNGKIIYSRGYGLANIEENVPITPQSVFDVASLSKQFIAMSILFLEKHGKLRLDDDVRRYIPELPDYAQQGQITIRDLLNHTSGVRDYVSLFLLAGIHFDNVTTENDALGTVARQKR